MHGRWKASVTGLQFRAVTVSYLLNRSMESLLLLILLPRLIRNVPSDHERISMLERDS